MNDFHSTFNIIYLVNKKRVLNFLLLGSTFFYIYDLQCFKHTIDDRRMDTLDKNANEGPLSGTYADLWTG